VASKPTAPTPEACARFVELVAGGMAPYDAARRVPGPVKRTADEASDPEILESHESSSRLRRHAQRGVGETAKPHEREFAQAYAEALELYDEITDDRIEAAYTERAFDPEKGKNGSSNRMLHNLALTRSRRRGSRLEMFTPLLEARTRHVHEGSIGHYPMIDASKLDDEEMETLAALLRKAGPDPGTPQVEAASRSALPSGAPAVIEQIP